MKGRHRHRRQLAQRREGAQSGTHLGADRSQHHSHNKQKVPNPNPSHHSAKHTNPHTQKGDTEKCREYRNVAPAHTMPAQHLAQLGEWVLRPHPPRHAALPVVQCSLVGVARPLLRMLVAGAAHSAPPPTPVKPHLKPVARCRVTAPGRHLLALVIRHSRERSARRRPLGGRGWCAGHWANGIMDVWIPSKIAGLAL